MKTLVLVASLALSANAFAYNNYLNCNGNDVEETDTLTNVLSNCGTPKSVVRTSDATFLTYWQKDGVNTITLTIKDDVVTEIK